MTAQTSSSKRIAARVGYIKSIHSDDYHLSIDFEGNPSQEPVLAAMGRPFTRAQINMAIDNQLDCRIDFMNGDLSTPIVRDIYFSVLAKDELVISAKHVVLKGTEEVVIGSGSAKTKFSGNDGRITTEADYITTNAQKSNKIQGEKITLN
ncbi:hypothetical protein GTG28_10150 [Vibrio sp. OCN044]|uniref:Uncharacterized protein n=1 Tax=Vibrio tetraodonis subsp. pristinus TaxID=2695891 RepID=A0A6L8LU15_9VIBR|nr:hypothetical protein [Vibrio tetraodonis]MYM59581.1 hypothetical protein [Vibrio tetraodonis subsp. pristinus]